MKRSLVLKIPGFKELVLTTVVSDYTGTHSCGGVLVLGVKQRLIQLSFMLDIHILTSDTFGTVRRELQGVEHTLHILEGDAHDWQKARYAERLGAVNVVAFGNGRNDRALLATVRDGGGLAIAVDNGEGCAVEALLNAHLFVVGSANALDLLLEDNGNRCKATLRA